jgi:hypothetical protein
MLVTTLFIQIADKNLEIADYEAFRIGNWDS